MLEFEESDDRHTTPSTFTIPFSSPTLKWARRKRLRCSNSGAVPEPSRHVSSPSPDCPPSDDVDHRRSEPHEWQGAGSRKNEEEEGEKVKEKEKEKEKEENDWIGEGRFLRSKTAAIGGGARNGRVGQKKKKAELWISLSREEIEEDFYSFTGLKLPRRPKKRPRTVSPDFLDRVFPGGWLPNMVTPEMYKVHQPQESRKSCRGR